MRLLVLLVAAAVAFGLDQLGKLVALRQLTSDRRYGVAGPVALQRRRNAAASLLRVPPRPASWLLAAVAATAGGLVAFVPSLEVVTAVGLGMTIGGAAGNLVDRRLRGAVVDFIQVGWWPTFNLADVALVAGPVLVLAGIR